MPDITPQAVADRFASALVQRPRANGDTFYCFQGDSPDWMLDVTYAAHGGMVPDDTRYAMIRVVASQLADLDDWEDLHELVDGAVDVYTARLTAWLASRLERVEYCDRAREEGLVAEGADMARVLMAGQYVEYMEIAASLVLSFRRQADDETSAAELAGEDR